MTEVGSRALRQHASQVAAHAAAADIIATDPRPSVAGLPAPKAPRQGEPIPSDVLQALRDGERY